MLYHCSTDIVELHKIKVLFLIVHMMQIPTSVLPPPQGKIIIPERENCFLVTIFSPNTFERAFSCYFLIFVVLLILIFKSGLTESSPKSYISSK